MTIYIKHTKCYGGSEIEEWVSMSFSYIHIIIIAEL